ncbi:phage Gp37/Gp68 family protein [Mesorhizobium sp. PAMC28654]|uniref:phage Gp37/Gp68 family protein n=1 Tax=Mesorhizobium sp. PAMC28654 TaxID=2880934 RepID=UPI001D0B92B4|nr:phage Gp37/Gp68 family protein [Mesorhizobium sp. PAMC28654]UDL90346.1 phage Gp37/Gp68 family protein [Mesorhizobium sp. PAMC28654]
MADGTKIEWTDATWNPITGCQVKSPGCKFCYAMKLAGTRLKHHWSREGLTVDTKNGPVWTGEVRFNEEWLTQPLRWTKPRMIFVCAHADLFYEAVPDEWIDRVFAVMALAPQHIFQVLTKRPDRMRAYIDAFNAGDRHILGHAREISSKPLVLDDILPEGAKQEVAPLPNVWLGTSVEDQARADERREPLRDIANAGWLTWVSYEPALGMVDWRGWEFIRWMVSGGESGPNARPHNPEWHYATRDFCAPNGIPYLFKQWGNWIEEDQVADAAATHEADLAAGRTYRFVGQPMRFRHKSETGRLLDGRTYDGFPQVSV